MFAILVPVSLSPLIITLLWAEHKTKKLGLIDTVEPVLDDSWDGTNGATSSAPTLLRRLRQVVAQLDLVGLVLLGTAVSLILLPLTLSQTVKGQWENGNVRRVTVGRYRLTQLSLSNFDARRRGRGSFSIRLLGYPCCNAPSYRSALLEKQECSSRVTDWFLRFRKSFLVFTIRPSQTT